VVARLLGLIALPGLILVLLVAAALALPLRPHGDAGEYLLMLESWHRHGSPERQPGDVESLRGLLQRERERLAIDESRVLPNYHTGRDGGLYCYHFWGYPFAGLPARRLLEALGVSPLRALPLTNAVLFGLALGACALLPWTAARRFWLVGLLLFSPALAFLMWPHPEVFSFALVTLALALAARGHAAAGVLAAALASLQNPPLVLLVAALAATALWSAWRRRSARAAVLTLVAAVPAGVPALFFLWQFGVFNLSVRPSEAAESLSAARALDLALDPNLGLLPHAPLTLALSLLAAAAALMRKRMAPALLVLALLPLLAYASTANSKWNNDTSGPSRYVVWMFPLVAFVAAAPSASPKHPLTRELSGALGLALAAQVVLLGARGGPLARSDFVEHSWARASCSIAGHGSTGRPRRSSASGRSVTRDPSTGRPSTAMRAAAAARPCFSPVMSSGSSRLVVSRLAARALGCGPRRARPGRSATGRTSTTDEACASDPRRRAL